MPSPFPGIDPYLEGTVWESFHFWFIGDIANALLPIVRPRYFVYPQQRVYVEYPSAENSRTIGPDVSVCSGRDDSSTTESSATATLTPVEVELALPDRRKEPFVTIRDAESQEVVTVIEVLSPTNKRPSNGQSEYLKKRTEILRSNTHLVEIDLLRGGERLPFVTPSPNDDFYAVVCRAGKSPKGDAFSWTLRQPMPTIPIPLRDGDPDVYLELQSLFNERYDMAGYQDMLNDDHPPRPPFTEADAAWASELIEPKTPENDETNS